MAHAPIGTISFLVLFHLKRQFFPIHSIFPETFDWFALISPVTWGKRDSEDMCHIVHTEFLKPWWMGGGRWRLNLRIWKQNNNDGEWSLQTWTWSSHTGAGMLLEHFWYNKSSSWTPPEVVQFLRKQKDNVKVRWCGSSKGMVKCMFST